MALQEMFPAVANSPATELSAAITDIQTTITLLDASKLPDAPNIATIGVDETAETVRYEGKSGNDLTGVTRGFSGTVAKAWGIGVGVARYFTAYDADALRENIKDNKMRLAERVQRVSNVAALKAGSFQAGDVVQTLGYFFRADSGGGDYLIRDDSSLVDDGGTVIDLDNGLKALLQYDRGYLNVKQFGAVGNGQVDDTVAIKKALSLLLTSFSAYRDTFYSGGVLFFPGGIYLLTEQLLATLNVKFEGINAASFKGKYSGSRNASVLRFSLADTSKPAIKFAGYDANGNVPSGLYVSLLDTSTSTMSSDNACMHNIAIETTNNSLLGIDLVNSTVCRLENVAVFNFKYGILANNCWGGSFEKLFIIASYVPFIFYYGNNGASIRDSYLTVSVNDVIPSPIGLPIPELNMYQYPLATVGIVVCGGAVSIDNVVVEGAGVAQKYINTIASLKVAHTERIKACLIAATGSKLNIDTLYMFNPDATVIPLINVASTSINLSNINSDLTMSTISDTSSNVTATNTDHMLLNDYSTIMITDKTISKDITFDSAVYVETTSGNVYKKVYREGRTVNIQFRCYLASAPTVGAVITVGTIPLGFRPKLNYSVNTYYGALSINSVSGAVTFTVKTSHTGFLYESVSYGV